ncbi:MAG: sulfotransferase [Anaerolineae bacterium]|nr:sulfotransferase [Anaerolineae bacterium]MCB0226149.1 sulfotransferase [Anaerolineae bacterium]
MKLPNFLIIGVPKSGTTALQNYLNQHPQIYLTPGLETNYFGLKDQLVDFRGPGDADTINRTAITTFDDYQAQFAATNGATAIGEVCPLYMYFPGAPARIKASIPNVKLVVILRNPIDRAYSNYLHLRHDGREPLAEFEQALAQENERMQAGWSPIWHYKTLGFYYEQLKPYYILFSYKQIRVYLYDELEENPQQMLQDMFKFLQVDHTFQPDLNLPLNDSNRPQSRTLPNGLTQPHVLQSAPITTRHDEAQNPLARAVNRIRNGNPVKPTLVKETRLTLMNAYREDVRATQALTGRKVSAWLTSQTAPITYDV